MTTVVSADGYSASLSLVETYYQDTNCSGAVVGTVTLSSALSATYVRTEGAVVSGWPTANSSQSLTVDRLSITAPATTTTLTGSGVTTIGGKLCVAYTNGSTCPDFTPNPPLSVTGGLAQTDTAVLLLQATTTGYTVDTAFQR